MGNICFPQKHHNTLDVLAACSNRTRSSVFEQISDCNRLEKWMELLQIKEEDLNPRYCMMSYEVAKKMVFKNLNIDYSTYPSFGTEIQWDCFNMISQEMKDSSIRLFYIVSEMNASYFAPQLPYLIVSLLRFYSEDIVYFIISSLLNNVTLRKHTLFMHQRYLESFIEQVNVINTRYANESNKRLSGSLPSLYGYVSRSWIQSLFLPSIPSHSHSRVLDAYFEVGIWLFPSLYVSYLNQYAGDLHYCTKGLDSEQACLAVQQHMHALREEELELLLINAIALVDQLEEEDQQIQERMRMMQKRIDEGEHILNICKYHMYFVMGPSKLLNASLCKEIMKELPVRVQSQDPRLIYTALIHGYHVTHLLEHAALQKPTLLFLQIEHSGNLIGLYREDSWSRRKDAHGVPDTLLFLIEFVGSKGDVKIQKWKGVMSDQFVDGMSIPSKYVYVRSPGSYLMIGAGGKKGISVYCSEDYLKSSSHVSDVFQNTPLCEKEFFSISNVELFCFVRPGCY